MPPLRTKFFIYLIYYIMGRTLHWTITTPEPITDEQNKKLIEFSKLVNDNIMWTCENFWVEKRDEKYKLPGDKANELRGFCKVRDNEWNAYCILMSLTHVHDMLPGSEIRLSDEGEFLYMPVLMKDGKYYVNWEDFNESMEYHRTKCTNHPEFLENDLKQKAYIESVTKPDGSLDFSDLHRPVNPEDFAKHESGGIYAGNFGEYWDKSKKKDADEAEARILGIFTKAFAGSDVEVSVCGERPIKLDDKPLPDEGETDDEKVNRIITSIKVLGKSTVAIPVDQFATLLKAAQKGGMEISSFNVGL